MANLEQSAPILGRTDAIRVQLIEADDMASEASAEINHLAILEGLKMGMNAAQDPDLNIRELLEKFDDGVFLEALSKDDSSVLAGLFIGALSAQYVIKENDQVKGESDV